MCSIVDKIPVYEKGKLPTRFEITIQEVTGRIREMNLPTVDAVILFGSAGRGMIKSTSDVDIWVVSNALITDRVIRTRIKECEDDLPCKVDIMLKTLDSVDVKTTFDRNLIRDSKLLWKKEASENYE